MVSGRAVGDPRRTLAELWSNETRFSRVDYRDVAEVAAIAVTEDRLLHGTFALCADGALNRHDVAALIGSALGREIKADVVDPVTLGDDGKPMLAMLAVPARISALRTQPPVHDSPCGGNGRQRPVGFG